MKSSAPPHPLRRLPFWLKVAATTSGVAVLGMAALTTLTFIVARSALEDEVRRHGDTLARQFAKTNALDFLAPEGVADIQLRADRMVLDEQSNLRAVLVFDVKGARLAASGDHPLGDQELVWVHKEVVYDRVPLGSVRLGFDPSAIKNTTDTLLRVTTLAGLLWLVTNLVILVLVVRYLLRPVSELGHAAEELAAGNYRYRIALPHSRDEIGVAADSFNRMCDALALHVRFSNAALVDRIRRGEINEQGEAHRLALLFGDARGYTRWSLDHAPPEIFETLSRYYTLIGSLVVQRHGGILDKFIGDGVMAHFGLTRSASPAQEQSAAAAIRASLEAAIAIQVALRVLEAAIEELEEETPLRYRLGVAFGPCVVGACGAHEVMLDYTVIGATVNLAARLEGKAPPGGIACDAATLSHVANRFDTQAVGDTDIKGMTQPVQVHFVRGYRDPRALQELLHYLEQDFFTQPRVHRVVFRQGRPEPLGFVRRALQSALPLPVGEVEPVPAPTGAG